MQINNQHLSALRPRMAVRQEHGPGAYAPATGQYEELIVFGARTGKVEHVHEGEPLPSAPLGFTWRQVVEEDC